MDGRSGTSVFTETLTLDERDSNRQDTRDDVPVLTLRVAKPKCSKQVKWTDGTVDNEHLNRRKSKCCCIYEKPRAFGESSSESDDECENCFGHVEKKKKNRKKKPDEDPNDPGDQPDSQDGAQPSTS